MAHNVLVSVIGPDRVGLVSALTGRLYEVGADLGDVSFAVLGTGCEFTGIVELPDDLSCEQVSGDLAQLPALADTEISVTEYRLPTVHGEAGHVSHHISVAGGDRPGLVARLTEVFVEFSANIVRMNSQRVPGSGSDRYVTDYYVAIPPVATDRCLAAVANTARQLHVECSWQRVDD
jgi:glycine cleavage system transcriptional repressor